MKRLSFNLEMARAFYEGRKSRTWRLMKKQPDTTNWKPEYLNMPKEWRKQMCLGPGHDCDPAMWCLFNVGDKANAIPYTGRKSPYLPGEIVFVAAPALMPEWASRAKVKILSCVPQRVRDVTEKEAVREGFKVLRNIGPDQDGRFYSLCAKDSFRRQIDSIYPGAWEGNLYGWGIEFERVK